jgi:hypothetical protein
VLHCARDLAHAPNRLRRNTLLATGAVPRTLHQFTVNPEAMALDTVLHRFDADADLVGVLRGCRILISGSVACEVPGPGPATQPDGGGGGVGIASRKGGALSKTSLLGKSESGSRFGRRKPQI